MATLWFLLGNRTGDDNVIDIILVRIARHLEVGRCPEADLARIRVDRKSGRIRPGQAIDQSIAIRIRRRRLIGCGLVLRDVDPVDVPVRVIVELGPGPPAVRIKIGLDPVDIAVIVVVEISPGPVAALVESVSLDPVDNAVAVGIEGGPVRLPSSSNVW